MPSAIVAGAVALVLGAASVAAFLVVRGTIDDQNSRILEERSGEIGLLFQTTFGSASTALRPLGVAARLGDPPEPAFLREARTMRASNPLQTIALIRRSGPRFDVAAVAGPRLERGTALSGIREDVVRRAVGSPGLVSSPVFTVGSQRILAFAIGPPVAPPASAIYISLPINPVSAAASSEPSFRDLNFALYAAPNADPAQLVFATTADLPLRGDVSTQQVSFGTAQWLLAVTAREPLVGSFANAVPLILLAIGLFITIVATAVVVMLARRRDYALALVDARTEELRRSLRELEETQSRLVFQERLAAIGQVAAAVGHELRNPLGVLTNALYLIRTTLGDDEERKVERHLKTAEREISASVVIVEGLLDFARSREPQSEPVDVAELVEESLSVSPPPDGITVTRDGLSGVPPVWADRQQLRQVLLNLLGNAYQAMDDEGVVRIETHVLGDELEISVSDEGHGMDTETTAQVFDPFFTRRAKGIGLGLAVTRQIIEAHGGTIAAESEPGVGSTFTLTLPLAPILETVA